VISGLYPPAPRLHDDNEVAAGGRGLNSETGRSSKDGPWRSFPKVPNLIQFAPNGGYYARITVGGKVIPRWLGTAMYLVPARLGVRSAGSAGESRPTSRRHWSAVRIRGL
jgi:hypothetical protein